MAAVRGRSSPRVASRLAVAAALSTLLVACGGGGGGDAPTAPPTVPPSEATSMPTPVRLAEIMRGLQQPWGLDFLPDGRLLVTERAGTLRLVAADGSTTTPVSGLPAVAAGGDTQGGLLDVVVGPRFAEDGRIFFTYAEDAGGATSRAVIASAVLSPGPQPALSALTVLHRQTPAVAGGQHFGSRIAIDSGGHLYVTFGERNQPPLAQDLGTTLGKVIRIRQDGSVPADNPYVGRPGARPEIWSHGHRNPQGITLEPGSDVPWVVEHGPLGGDEVNRLVASGDYGWPRITQGRDYATGQPLGEGTTDPAVEPAVFAWVPVSIAPSSLLFYRGTALRGWDGSLLVGALAGQAVVRLTLSASRVVAEERLFESLAERFRALRTGPDGLVYLLTDSGRLLRIEPD